MGDYTHQGWMGAVMKAIFGIVLAFVLGWVLNSLFLGVLTFAILAFLPMDNEEEEYQANGILFAFVMFILLILAFSPEIPFLSSYHEFGVQGLGIDLGIKIGLVHYISLGVLILFCILKGVFMAPKGLKKLRINVAEDAFSNMLLLITIIALLIWNIILFQPWNWNFTAILFSGIWVLTFFNGVFGGIEIKQTFGVVIIMISFLIYTFGVGSDVVGSAAFGQWWAPVKDFGKQTLGPLKDAVEDMFKSFKEAIKLLTCPTCAAKEILQGVYTNPTGKGKTGSFGVEFEELSVPESKLTLGRPFSVNLGIKNQGAKDAQNVVLTLSLPGTPGYELPLEKANQNPVTEKKFNEIVQEDAKQFVAVGTLDCESIKKTDLVKKSSFLRKTLIETGQEFESQLSTDIKAEASYSYSSDSELTLEFISKAERERLLKEKKLERRKEKSKITTSPVAVSLFVDIDQPIEEGTRFYLGVEVKAQEKDGYAKGVEAVINLPDEFVPSGTPRRTFVENIINKATGDIQKGPRETSTATKIGEFVTATGGKIVKENPKADLFPADIEGKSQIRLSIPELPEGESTRVFFDFAEDTIRLPSPTKTVAITAQTKFDFVKQRSASVSFAFGGYCCPDIEGACYAGTRCDYNAKEKLGVCIADKAEGVGGVIEAEKLPPKGSVDYCEKKAQLSRGVARCAESAGQCTSSSTKKPDTNLCANSAEDGQKLKCEGVSVSIYGTSQNQDACCKVQVNGDVDKLDCAKGHLKWLQDATAS